MQQGVGIRLWPTPDGTAVFLEDLLSSLRAMADVRLPAKPLAWTRERLQTRGFMDVSLRDGADADAVRSAIERLPGIREARVIEQFRRSSD